MICARRRSDKLRDLTGIMIGPRSGLSRNDTCRNYVLSFCEPVAFLRLPLGGFLTILFSVETVAALAQKYLYARVIRSRNCRSALWKAIVEILRDTNQGLPGIHLFRPVRVLFVAERDSR